MISMIKFLVLEITREKKRILIIDFLHLIFFSIFSGSPRPR